MVPSTGWGIDPRYEVVPGVEVSGLRSLGVSEKIQGVGEMRVSGVEGCGVGYPKPRTASLGFRVRLYELRQDEG